MLPVINLSQSQFQPKFRHRNQPFLKIHRLRIMEFVTITFFLLPHNNFAIYNYSLTAKNCIIKLCELPNIVVQHWTYNVTLWGHRYKNEFSSFYEAKIGRRQYDANRVIKKVFERYEETERQ